MPNPEVTTIGKYEIQAELGHGGFGIVYRAFDPTVGRPVAIKILTVEGNRDVLTRFRNEATSAGNLRHRNIVTVHDYGEFNGRPYLVMELLEGENLADVIAGGSNLTLLQKMTIMDQVADGLECAHRNGVVHRDVKPANIQILPDGTVKIMDFGIARVNRDREATRLTQQGDLIGTILYMSPEQFGGADADALCDIFAYGVTYFEFLTGKHPFRSTDPRAVMFKITVEDAPSVRSMAPDCPEGLELILNRALQKDRELRYHNLRDLRLDAEPLILDLKREKAVALVAEAHQFSDEKEAHKAIAVINEALDLDPGNREARQLREVIQRQLQKEVLQPRITALMQTAEEQLAKRSYAMAVQTLEGALRLDQTDTRIRGALDHAREQLQKFKDAARTAMAAVSDMNRGEWAAASAKANEAASLDPTNKDAVRVLEAFGKHINSALSLVNSQIARREVDAALAGLKELEVLKPDSEEVQKKLSVAQALKQENDRILAILDSARRLMEESRFEEAIKALRVPSLPDEPTVRQLRKQAEDGLAAQRRMEAIEKAAGAVETLLEASNVDEAVRQIDNAVRTYPNEKRLGEVRAKVLAAKSSRERDKLRKWVSENFDRLYAENRFAEAMEIVQVGLRAYADEPMFLELQQKVQEHAEKAKRDEAVRQAVAEGNRLLAQNRPQQAIEVLQKATAQYPQQEGIERLLAEAIAGQKSREREEAVTKAIAEAQDRVNRQNFDEALAILEEPLKSWPEEAQLLASRQQILDQRASWQRQVAINEVTRQCNKLTQDKRFEQALAVLDSGLQKFPDEPGLIELRRKVQEQLALQKRTASIQQKLTDCRKLLLDGSAQAAINTLEKALQEFPGEDRFIQLLAEAREQLLAEQRRDALDQASREGNTRLASKDFEGAIQFLEKTLLSLPGEAALEELLKQGLDGLARQSRERAVAAIAEQGENLLSQRRFTDALAAIDAGLREFENESALVALKTKVREQEEKERRERAAAIKQNIEESRRLLDQDEPRAAVEALQKALEQFPEEAQLSRLLTEAREKLLIHERRIAVDQAALEAEALVSRHEFQAAAQVLAQALQSWPLDSKLAKLLQDTVDARAAFERKQGIEAISRDVEELAGQRRFAEALASLQNGLRKYPNDPVLVDLTKKVQAQEEEERRDRAAKIASALAESQRLIEQGKFEQAEGSLERAIEQFPEVGRFKDLLADAREKLLAEQHRKAVDKATTDAKARAGQQDFEGATGILEQALKSWPGDAQLTEMLQGVRAAQSAWERERTVQAIVQQAEQLAGESRFADALAGIDQGLARLENEPALAEARRKILEKESQERQRRAAAIRQRVDDAKALLALHKTQSAIEAIERSAKEFPEEEQFSQLLAHAREQLLAEQRQEAVEAAAREAKALEKAQNFDAAIQLLESALKSWPGESSLTQLVASVREAQAARERQERERRAAAVRQQLDAAKQLLAQHKTQPAIDALQKALEQFPGEEALVQLLAQARAQLQAEQKQAAIAQAIQEAQDREKKQDFDGAIQVLENALKSWPEDPRLAERVTGVRAAKEQCEQAERERRAAAIRKEIESAQSLLAERKTQLAVEALQKALIQFPGEEQLLQWIVQARKQLQAEQKQAAVDKATREAHACQEKQDFDGAIGVLESALKSWPEEISLTERLGAVREARELWQRQRAVDEISKQCEQLAVASRFAEALAAIQTGLQSYPSDSALLELQRRIQQQEEQARRERTEAVRKRTDECRLLLDQGKLEKAVEAALQARGQFPEEPSIEELLKQAQEQLQKWQRQQEIDKIKKQAEALLAENKPDVAIALIENRFATAPELTELLTRARKEVDAKHRDALLQRATGLGREARYEEALATIDQAIQQFGSTAEAVALQARLRTEFEQEQRRRTRKKDLEKLLEIERQVGAAPRKKKLKQLGEQALQVAATYSADEEFSAALARIQGIVGSTQQPTTERKPIPRAWIGAGVGAIAVITAAVFILRPKPPAPLIALEIRSDPPGASVRLGDQSCTTPNCRFDMKPGSYPVHAELKGYQQVDQTVVVDASKPAIPVSLTLQPMPQPAPAATTTVATGTLLVETGIADALVLVNGVPRQRTEANGTLRLELEPNRYRVSVQKNDYQATSEQQVKVAAGVSRKLSFKLAPLVAKTEPPPPPVISSGGAPPVNPIAIPSSTPPSSPPPAVKTATAEPTEDQEWEKIKNASEPTEIQKFLDKYGNGAHKQQALALLQNLQANSAWGQVNKNDLQALTTFRDQYPNSSHKQEAQNRIDQLNQQAQANAEAAKRNQQQQALLQGQRQEIDGVLDNLGTLIARKRWGEVRKIWPSVSPALEQTRDDVRLSRKGEPVITGDSASVDCELVIQYVMGRRAPQVITERVTLQKGGDGHWSVAAMTPKN